MLPLPRVLPIRAARGRSGRRGRAGATLVAALILTTSGLLGAATPPASASATPASAAASPDPLHLSIGSLTPSVIPAHGPITVRGVLTNVSGETWTDINVHAFMGSDPITRAPDLARAITTPEAADVGNRFFEPGSFDPVGALAPGESTPYVVRVPRSLITVTEPGVYWFGVHALGATSAGRVDHAVARARTFLSLVPASVGHVDTALVLPLRAPQPHAPDGSLADVSGWARSLRRGPLRAVLDLGRSAGSRPLTWLVDPAVPDAVRRLVAGNPQRSLASNLPPDSSESPSDGASPSSSGSPSASASATPPAPEAELTPNAAQRPGQTWLDDLHAALDRPRNQLLGLPYGDLDVTAAAHHDDPLLTRAVRRTGRALAPWGLPLTRTVAPPGGYVDAETIDALPTSVQILAASGTVRGRSPAKALVNGHLVVLSSRQTTDGGPGPTNPVGPIALRQRIIAEAALRVLSPHPKALVAVLPQTIPASIGVGFWAGLDLPWLRLSTLTDAKGQTGSTVAASRLRYPPAAQHGELEQGFFAAADRLVAVGQLLQAVLPRNDTVAGAVADEALSGAGVSSRTDPLGAAARLDASRAWVRDTLSRVAVQGPPGVTLSSDKGKFSATLSNDLDVPVQVRLRAVTDPKLDVSGGDAITLPPHGRSTVLLTASTDVLGVHLVRLVVTDETGRSLGSADVVTIRSAHVSGLIWGVMAVGTILLFGAIGVRLARRIRDAARA
ncbi:MAG: DUF6049 family protein [Nocardioides sp.]